MQRISALGLDLGHRRIGVAGCDGTGLIATGITTIQRTSFAQDVETLRRLVEQRQVQTLVIGLPYTMDGELGTQAQRTQKLALRIGKALNLPIDFVDERLTSHEAESMMRAQRVNASKHRALIDRKAAALILQRWLDQKPWLTVP
ncbi:Holliday junction resolvase RuvX [Acaryochloris sp. IP29b_bin.137]|uniref:Holliday junction resolvase RuvX n=1 Tax=Acaryochloris sp. IP29b_bin.137 TaxID=2969217 RepID=UPI002639338A|nr:Holliday junction resolvase RuvX [Acaryochloris sp. IP29b_bin.137]